MSVTSADAEHEARHCVAAWYMGRRVERAALDLYALDQGVVRYSCPERDYGAADLVINMVGWLGDPDLPERAAWPEPWPPRINAPEGVGVLTRRLGLSQAAYERCCQIAEELVEQPAFKEAVALVARALLLAPLIDAEGLDVLRRVAFTDEISDEQRVEEFLCAI